MQRSLFSAFDTAAPTSIIDTAAARKLYVSAISSGIIKGAGKGDVTADDAGEVRLTLGGLTTRVPHAKIVDLTKVPVPVKADGLLGAEFLSSILSASIPPSTRLPFITPTHSPIGATASRCI
jgi:hypothetical protein